MKPYIKREEWTDGQTDARTGHSAFYNLSYRPAGDNKGDWHMCISDKFTENNVDIGGIENIIPQILLQ